MSQSCTLIITPYTSLVKQYKIAANVYEKLVIRVLIKTCDEPEDNILWVGRMCLTGHSVDTFGMMVRIIV